MKTLLKDLACATMMLFAFAAFWLFLYVLEGVA